MSIHRPTLDTAVTEFLRTHQDGAKLLLQFMSSVPADAVPLITKADSATHDTCMEQFNRQRERAIINRLSKP